MSIFEYDKEEEERKLRKADMRLVLPVDLTTASILQKKIPFVCTLPKAPVPFWKTSNKDPCEAVQKLFPGKLALPATMPYLFLLRLALQYNSQSAQFHVLLPDRPQLPSAFRQVPDDATSRHLRKSNSYLNEELSCS